ncbi:MAG TPA: YIP1 family protein [bacterium]|nr:YIP1 family protein [bacterium]
MKENNEMNIIERIVGVFFSPRATMQSIDHQPSWIAPFVILILLAVVQFQIISPITMPKQMQLVEEQLRERGSSEDEIERTLGIVEKFSKFGFINVIIFTVLFYVLFSLLLWFLGNIILGGETTFKKIFSVNLYAGLISALGIVISIPLILIKKSINIHFSLASLLSDDQIGTFLYRVLRSFDIFSIWYFVVLTIGFSVIYKFSIKKSATAMVFVFVLYSLLMVWVFGAQQENLL